MLLKQDISSTASMMGVNAHYFNVVYISEDAVAEFHGDGWSLRTTIKSGFKLDLTIYGTPCTEIVFESVNPQHIRFWAGLAKADDSSLSGAISIDSANNVNYLPKKTITNLTEIFPANTARLQGTYQITNNCYLNDDVDGIELPAGVYQWVNKQPLSLKPVSGSVVVKAIDELF